jgi:hypothetical protein
MLAFSAFAAQAATFTNSSQIVFFPGGAVSLYPSPITVSGMTGVVAFTPSSVKVTVNAFTHTIPGEVGMALCSPGGVCCLLQAAAGGITRVDNVTYTLSDLGAMPLTQSSLTAGTFRPTAYDLRVFNDPGPITDYQNPGPASGGTATLASTFHGVNPNGTWNLYLVGAGGVGRIDGGWTLELETEPVAHPQHTVDFDGDGRTDFALARNIGGGASGQLRWFINPNGTSTVYGADWGLASDTAVPADFDGDRKTDIAVWRPVSIFAPSGNAFFYILQSQSNTVRIEDFGQAGDDPTVVGDYNGDGRADIAVYRDGVNAGQSYWYFRTTAGGAVNYEQWGLDGDKPAPGDYDGDGKYDFVIRRDNGPGQSRYWLKQTTAGISTKGFGLSSDVMIPGDYDGDGKTDLAIVRNVSGMINWWYLRSSDSAAVQTVFGRWASDRIVQGDYDGDGATDIAVWRDSTNAGVSAFWVRGSASAPSVMPFGQSGDYPVANFNVH